MSNVSEFSLSWIFGDRTEVKKEKKIPRRVFTFSRRSRIRKFYDMFVQWRQIIVPQSVLQVQNFWGFFMFSLPSPSLLLLLPFTCAHCLYSVLRSTVQYTGSVISMTRRVILIDSSFDWFYSSEMYWYLNRKRISWASGGRERHLRLLGVRAVASRWPNCLQDGMGFEISSCFQIERTARR